MSEREEKNKKALSKISEELAKQPKQDGEGTEDSKEKRAVAEKQLNAIKKPLASSSK